MDTTTGPRSLSEFRTELLTAIYDGHYTFVEDNFDFFMYGFDADPKWVQWGQHVAYLDYVLTHLESYYAAYLLFDDMASRDLFFRLIKFRCLGSAHMRIQEDLTFQVYKEVFDRVERVYLEGPSKIPFSGLFGPLSHFRNIPTDGQPIALDCWTGNVAQGLGFGKYRQYFYDRDGLCIGPEPRDVVIDGGACFGESGAFFAEAVGPAGRVYSFDPLPTHIEIIKFNIAQNNFTGRMFAVPKGLGDSTNSVDAIDPSLNAVGHPGFSLARCSGDVPVTTLDDFVAKENPHSIDFIKLDIEGFELATLHGAAKTLDRYRPKLAISLYHKPQDFYEIPFFIKRNFPFYRLHLAHYTLFMDETVLYAIADR